MIVRLLLIAASAYGAAIPPPTGAPPMNPSCLEKCLATGGVVGAAADLNFFKSVAVDVSNFCSVYENLLKCASSCSADDLALINKHTQHASWVCKDKIEEFKTVHDCLEADSSDPLAECGKECEMGENQPLRLDSSPSAPVNPNVPTDSLSGVCTKQMCALKCSTQKLNKQCAGSGDLFKEAAKHQVMVGWERLQMLSENANDTDVQLSALSYLANVPQNCVFITNSEVFDAEFNNDSISAVENPAASETGNLDLSLFEFAPANDPDLPVGAPEEKMNETLSTPSLPVLQEEEPIRIIGGLPSTSTTAVASTDEASASKETEASSEPTPEPEAAESKEEHGGLPAEPVSGETAEKEATIPEGRVEDDRDEKDKTEVSAAMPTPATEGAGAEEASSSKTTEEEEEEEEGTNNEDGANMSEIKDSASVESTSPQITEPVIVVDDDKEMEKEKEEEEEGEVDRNEVVPAVTEKMKVNSSGGNLLLPALCATLLSFFALLL